MLWLLNSLLNSAPKRLGLGPTELGGARKQRTHNCVVLRDRIREQCSDRTIRPYARALSAVGSMTWAQIEECNILSPISTPPVDPVWLAWLLAGSRRGGRLLQARESTIINVSCGVRTHAQLSAVDLKSTPLATRAN